MTAPLTDRERAMCREAAARAVREVRGLDGAHDSPSDTAIAAKLYPEPAPAEAVVSFNEQQWRYNEERQDLDYRNDPSTTWRDGWMTVADVRTLASLLPKRELTDEIVRRAFDSWPVGVSRWEAIRAALLSVWDDIAAPAPVLKPQWWGVVGADNEICMYRVKEDAQDWAEEWDGDYPANAPHRVVALAEVPHAE